MADEYFEVEISDVEDLSDSLPPPSSDYEPNSNSDDFVNDYDASSDSEGSINENRGNIINQSPKKTELELEGESLRASLEDANWKIGAAELQLDFWQENLEE